MSFPFKFSFLSPRKATCPTAGKRKCEKRPQPQCFWGRHSEGPHQNPKDRGISIPEGYTKKNGVRASGSL